MTAGTHLEKIRSTMGTRARLEAALRAAPEGLDAEELAERLGVHANTVRWHLGALARADAVSSTPRPHVGRGRPRIVYQATGDQEGTRDEYRLLAAVLSATLAAQTDGAAACEAAGRELGRYLVPRRLPLARPSDGEACATVTELLAEQGFRPVVADGAVRMRRCPFHELAESRPQVVCAVHRGLIDGALEEIGSDLRVSTLDVFVEPALCIARLTSGPSEPSSPAASSCPA
jgi:predicted ArsR family transcriptional regulator